MILPPTSGIRCSGSTRIGASAEALVEAAGDLAHQLDVLALVLADRHLVRLVGEHVGRLQHRIEEERRRDQLALLRRLLLELVHAVEVAVGGDRREQPGELGVLADVGLAKEDAALRVEPRGDQDRGGVVEALAQLGRARRGPRSRAGRRCSRSPRRRRPVLALDVLADRADVVAEVLAPGRLDAAEDPHAANLRSEREPGRRAPPLRRAPDRLRLRLGPVTPSAQRPHSPAVAAAPARALARARPRPPGCAPRAARSRRRSPSARRRSASRGERPTPRRRRSSASSARRLGGGHAADVAAGERLLLRVLDRRRASAPSGSPARRRSSSARRELRRDHRPERRDREQRRRPARRRC